MDYAYLFPNHRDVDAEHVHEAKWVMLDEPYATLHAASGKGCLRCIYLGCLGEVRPVRWDRDDDDHLRCFAHVDPELGSPPCPYRSSHGGGRSRREHIDRKCAENDVRATLAYKHAARNRSTALSCSDLETPPLIRITGLEEPLQIHALVPDQVSKWRPPFDGKIGGEQVLFFALDTDSFSYSERQLIDQHLLAVRPGIVIRPARNEREKPTWAVVRSIGDAPKEMRPLLELDLIRVDYGRFFGAARPPETLFIPTPYREAIAQIDARLQEVNVTTAMTSMLRALAAHLLVEGAAVREPSSGPQTAEVAPLLEDTALRRFCGANPLLDAAYGRVVVEFVNGLQAALAGERAARARTEAALDATRMELEETGKALGTAGSDIKRLAKEGDTLGTRVGALEKDLARLKEQLKELERLRGLERKHWLVRLDGWLHSKRTAARQI